MSRVQTNIIGYVNDVPVTNSDVPTSAWARISPWVRLGILATIAGYKFSDTIGMAGWAPMVPRSKSSLEAFLDYLLTDERYHSHGFKITLGLCGRASASAALASGTVV